jgi:protein gp37
LGPLGNLDLAGLDWLIVGGESGPGHRPVRAEWVRQLRDRCQTEKVAFFFKQWGGIRSKAGGRLLDGRTWDEPPAVAPASLP